MGIKGVVCALMLNTVITLARKSLVNLMSVLVCAAAVVLALFTPVPTVAIVVLAGLCGAVIELWQRRCPKGRRNHSQRGGDPTWDSFSLVSHKGSCIDGYNPGSTLSDGITVQQFVLADPAFFRDQLDDQGQMDDDFSISVGDGNDNGFQAAQYSREYAQQTMHTVAKPETPGDGMGRPQ